MGGNDLASPGRDVSERGPERVDSGRNGRGFRRAGNLVEVGMNMYLVSYSVRVCRNVGGGGVRPLAPGLL